MFFRFPPLYRVFTFNTWLIYNYNFIVVQTHWFMKKRNLLFTMLLVSIGINLLLSYTNIRTTQSYSKDPNGTYMFSMDSDKDGEYEQYYLLFYPKNIKKYEIRLLVGSSNPHDGSVCENIEEGFYEIEYDNYIIHTTSSKNEIQYFFLTTDNIYFIKDDNLIVCEKLADYVYRI